MSIRFHPKPGTLLICDFTTGFQPPEMVKRRPVVVVSPRVRRHSSVCTVVPLSTSRPHRIELHHHLLDHNSLPGRFSQPDTWAKCDMLTTVALTRLDRIYLGKNPEGRRLFAAPSILQEDFDAIQQCILVALGLQPHLIAHLA